MGYIGEIMDDKCVYMIHYAMEQNLHFCAPLWFFIIEIDCMRSQVNLSIEVYWSQEESNVTFHYISKGKWYITSLYR
jgi:hypothetical protein